MGTSQAYDGPTTPQWSQLKTRLTTLFKRGAVSQDEVRDLVRAYMRSAHPDPAVTDAGVPGGEDLASAAPATTCNASALQTALNLARVFETLFQVHRGQNASLTPLLPGLATGHPRDALFTLVNYCAPDGCTLEDVSARYAALHVLSGVLADAPQLSAEDALVAAARAGRVPEILRAFFGRFYFHGFTRTIYERVIRNAGHDAAVASLNQAEQTTAQLLLAVPTPALLGPWHSPECLAALTDLCAAVRRKLADLR